MEIKPLYLSITLSFWNIFFKFTKEFQKLKIYSRSWRMFGEGSGEQALLILFWFTFYGPKIEKGSDIRVK